MTLVLYFGCKKHWDKPLSLKERLDIPPEFEPFVSDYKVNLFEIAYLTHEQVELFQSDFRIVADYFVQKREKGEHGEYTPDPRQIRHVQETLQLLSVMTRDHRFEEAYNEAYTKDGMEGGPHTMCEFLDRVENRGIEKGLSEGPGDRLLPAGDGDACGEDRRGGQGERGDGQAVAGLPAAGRSKITRLT